MKKLNIFLKHSTIYLGNCIKLTVYYLKFFSSTFVLKKHTSLMFVVFNTVFIVCFSLLSSNIGTVLLNSTYLSYYNVMLEENSEIGLFSYHSEKLNEENYANEILNYTWHEEEFGYYSIPRVSTASVFHSRNENDLEFKVGDVTINYDFSVIGTQTTGLSHRYGSELAFDSIQLVREYDVNRDWVSIYPQTSLFITRDFANVILSSLPNQFNEEKDLLHSNGGPILTMEYNGHLNEYTIANIISPDYGLYDKYIQAYGQFIYMYSNRFYLNDFFSDFSISTMLPQQYGTIKKVMDTYLARYIDENDTIRSYIYDNNMDELKENTYFNNIYNYHEQSAILVTITMFFLVCVNFFVLYYTIWPKLKHVYVSWNFTILTTLIYILIPQLLYYGIIQILSHIYSTNVYIISLSNAFGLICSSLCVLSLIIQIIYMNRCTLLNKNIKKIHYKI